MKSSKSPLKILNEKKKTIYEMINSSIELSEKIGKHPLKKGCNCISCVSRRKKIIKRESNWEFKL